MRTVAIVDYGLGNLLSVARAFEHCGAIAQVSADPLEFLRADALVLPGVGAFADGMAGLAERGLVSPIKEFASRGRPLLGICLGMQLLFERSEELAESQGLGLIPGSVLALPSVGTDGKPHKIPHVGWSQVVPSQSTSWSGTILQKTAPGTSFYFVHSFAAVPSDRHYRLADCRYDGQLIAAAVRNRNVLGCQFHPEKSGDAGLVVIRDFLNWTPGTRHVRTLREEGN